MALPYKPEHLPYYYQNFTDRWQDFINYIHQKVAAYERKLASEVKDNPNLKGKDILQKHPYPLTKYQILFEQLLPNKKLLDINPAQPTQFFYKVQSGDRLPFTSLSSVEQEVVKVIFDVARKDIKHSIIIVDEPELHLHPTLTFKLIETLKSIGEHTNQFIFLTHSADLISTYYSTGNVYFIDCEQTGANQAHRLSDLNHSHKELVKIIGENLGLFAVGKKIVFVEGENSSIDRSTYHSIAQKLLPEAKITPARSVENIIALNSIAAEIKNSLFGINFYMIRDRDGLSDQIIQNIEKDGRIKCLKKRHIENYFLDAEVLFRVAEKLYITSTKNQLTKEFIEAEIKRIAKETLNFTVLQNLKEYVQLNHSFNIPTVKSVETKSLDDIKKEMTQGLSGSLNELQKNLSSEVLSKWIDDEQKKLTNALATETWQTEFHGKVIFSKVCSDILKEDHIRVRQAYVDIALEEKDEVFKDIIDIFKYFGS